MKVLAIGGAGHVGSEVVKELLKRNAEVDVLVRKEGTKVSEGPTLSLAISLIRFSWRKPWTG